MAIKCSLLGHKFGDSTVERDREEQGSEVIITIEEIETCQRCGETRVVSENKEVTSLEMPEDVDEEPAEGTTDQSVDSDSVEATEPSEPTAAEPETGTGPEPDEDTEPVTEAEPAETDEEPPVTDDAEILDEDDDVDRSPGEWPQEAEPETNHDEEDFDQYGYMDEETDTVDEEATDAEFIDEGPSDGEVIDEAAADLEDVDDMAEEPPADAETNAWPSETEAEDPVERGPPTGPGAVTVPDGEFVCRACGFSTPVEESSLREGDFCPECHKETLVQVREQ